MAGHSMAEPSKEEHINAHKLIDYGGGRVVWWEML